MLFVRDDLSALFIFIDLLRATRRRSNLATGPDAELHSVFRQFLLHDLHGFLFGEVDGRRDDHAAVSGAALAVLEDWGDDDLALLRRGKDEAGPGQTRQGKRRGARSTSRRVG